MRRRTMRERALQCLVGPRTPGRGRLLFGVATVAIALLLMQCVPTASQIGLPLPLYLFAAIGATWFGGIGAGLVAAVAGVALLLPSGITLLGVDGTTAPVIGFRFVTALAIVLLTARLRAAIAQLSSERARYQSILHSVGDILMVVDGQGRLEFFNRRAKEKLGLQVGSVGRPLRELLPLVHGGTAFDPLAGTAEHRTMYRLPDTLEVDLPGRTRLCLSGSLAPVSGADGTRGHVLSLQDTSELHESHERLARSEAKLRALFDSELLAIFTIDLEGRLCSANAAFWSMLGYSEHEIADAPTALRTLTPAEHWPADDYAVAELAARGSCRPYEKMLLRRDGRPVQVTVGGAIVQRNEAAFFVIDTDARNEADARVRETRQLLQSIIDSVPAFVAYIDRDARYMVGNRQRLGQLEPAVSPAGRPLIEVFEHEQYVKLAPHLRRALSGVAAQTQLTLFDDHGQERQYAVQLQPRYRDDSSEVEGVVMHAFDITEQLERQRALHDSEVRFRRLAESTAAIVFQIGVDGAILYLSGWRRFTGDGDIARHIAELYARAFGTDRLRLRRFLLRCRDHHGTGEIEFRLRHASGEYRQVAVRVVPIPGTDDGSGRCQWVGSARDVHDKRAALERLQHAEQELRLMLDTMPARTAYIEADGRFRWANRAFLEWFGRSDDIRGASLAEVLSGADLIALGDAIERGFRGQPSQVEWMQEHPIRGTRWSLTTVTPDVTGDGTVAGCITLDTDHTERKRTEQALRRSNREHRALAESVPHMVWIAYGDGRMFYFNQRWRDYTSLTTVDPWHRAVFADDRRMALSAFREAIANGHDLAIELRLLRDDGAARWHMMRAVPVADEGMRITRWYGTCTDIEDQKQAQNILQRAQERTQQFLATLSHELRNPLAALMTSAHLLNREDLPEPQRPLLGQTIRRQTVQLQRLVEDLLDISRITQGKVELKLDDVELGHIIDHVCDDFGERARRNEVRLLRVRAAAEGEYWVRGDAARLRQIADNLVSNALKATPTGGEIRLQLSRQQGRHVLSVCDSGPGIPAALMPRMFEPFVQGESWRERGLGLGLSIVTRMAQLHGGEVLARNIGGGQGACFEVALPAIEVGQRIAEPATAYLRGDSATELLIIDDEIDHADALKMLLELQGYRPSTANDGETALQMLAGRAFDAVICDLGLPGEWNGYRLASRIRADHGSGLLLIAFSGYGAAHDVERALAAGFDSHLLKPSTPAEVIAALQQGIECKRQATVTSRP